MWLSQLTELETRAVEPNRPRPRLRPSSIQAVEATPGRAGQAGSKSVDPCCDGARRRTSTRTVRRRVAARRHKIFFQRGRIVTVHWVCEPVYTCVILVVATTVALRFFGGPRQIDGNGQASLNTKDVFCGRFVPYDTE